MRSAASGDVVYFKIGLRRSYLITSLSDIRHALQDQRPQLPQESAADLVPSPALLMVHGDHQSAHRQELLELRHIERRGRQ
jgi:hypothetical protein